MIGKVLSGRYRIIELVGKGGMATVYKAVDTKLHRTVAVKVIHPAIAADPQFAEHFRTEARNGAALNHPNVVAVYDVGEDDGDQYLVTEFVEGRSLRAIVDDGPVPLDRALRYARQLAAGLAAAHDRGIVHCDIKPQNILVTPDGIAKLADFGISRAVATTGVLTGGMLVGTLEYLAPEQIEGRQPDERSDLYALGLVIYEMLAGRLPFDRAATPAQALAIRLRADPTPLTAVNPTIPPEFAAVVMRVLRKDPAERYQTASSLGEALAWVGAVDGQDEATVGGHDAPTVVVARPAERESGPALRPAKRENDLALPRQRLHVAFLTGAATGVLLIAVVLILARAYLPTSNAAASADGSGAGIGARARQLGSAVVALVVPPTPTPTFTPIPTPTSMPIWAPMSPVNVTSLPPTKAVENYVQGLLNGDATLMWVALSDDLRQSFIAQGGSLQQLQQMIDQLHRDRILWSARYVFGKRLSDGRVIYGYILTGPSPTGEMLAIPYMFTVNTAGKIESID